MLDESQFVVRVTRKWTILRDCVRFDRVKVDEGKWSILRESGQSDRMNVDDLKE